MQKKSVLVNAYLNMLRQLLAILFPMVTVYYANRVLGKNNFGEVNYIKSIVSYFSLAAGLGISNYAIREGAYIRKEKDRYTQFASEVYTINIISTFISCLGLLLLCIWYLYIGNSKDAFLLIILGSAIILVTAGADWINTTYEDFLYLTVRYILFYLLSFGLLFFTVRAESSYNWYALVTVTASAGGNILNIFYIRRYAKLHIAKFVECKKHLKPIFVLFGSSIASVIYISSDTTMLGMIIGNEAVAIYTVASNIYVAVKHIANAAITVIMPRLSNYLGSAMTDEYCRLYNKITSYVIVVLLPLVAGTYELSDSLMVFMGESDYIVGASSLRVLSFALLFAVLSYVLSRCVTLPFKEDKVFTLSTVVSAIANLVLNIVLIPKCSYLGAAITTLISEIIVFIILFYNSHKHVKHKVDGRVVISSVIGCIGIVIICEIINRCFYLIPIINIIVSFVFSVLVYFFIMLLFKNSVILDSIQRIVKHFSK